MISGRRDRAIALLATLFIVALGVRGIDWSQRNRIAGMIGGCTAPVDAWRIDPNRATAVELALLPGVGPTIAQRIVEVRTREGAFRSVDDLERVPGIGPATIARLRSWVEIAPDRA